MSSRELPPSRTATGSAAASLAAGLAHSDFKGSLERPIGALVGGRCRPGCFKLAATPLSCRDSASPCGSVGAREALDIKVALESVGIELTCGGHEAQRHPGCRWQRNRGRGICDGQRGLRWRSSAPLRARPRGEGWGSTPRCGRIFSITGRSRMAAMILSSPPLRFGQVCISKSKARLSSRAQLIRCGRVRAVSISHTAGAVASVSASCTCGPGGTTSARSLALGASAP